MAVKFNRADFAELVIGACVLAFPIAVTEEVWNLSHELTVLQVSLLAALSCSFLSLFIYFVHGNNQGDHHVRIDFVRILATYGVTLAVCAIILALVGKFPIGSDTAVAIKRTILVAFPASFSATVVDNLK